MNTIDRDAVIELIDSVAIETYSFGGQTYEDCVGTITKIIEAVRALPAQPDPRDESLRLAREALVEVQDLINESKGVFGLHMNGDIAPWGDIERGGFFERLSTLPEALAAIDALIGDN